MSADLDLSATQSLDEEVRAAAAAEEEHKDPPQSLDDSDDDSDSDTDTDSDYDAEDHIERKERELRKLQVGDMTAEIQLVVNGTPHTIIKKYAMPSKFIRGFFEQFPQETVMPLTSIAHPELFPSIMEYLNHHKGIEQPIIPSPLKSKNMAEVCKPPLDPWDADFIDGLAKDMQQVYNLTTDVNYLTITPLLHLACAKIASQVKPMTPEEIQAGIEKQKREAEAAAAAEKAAAAAADKDEEMKE